MHKRTVCKSKVRFFGTSIFAVLVIVVIGCGPRKVRRIRVDTASIQKGQLAAHQAQSQSMIHDVDDLQVISPVAYVQEQEARLADVAIPINSSPCIDEIPINDLSDHILLVYDVFEPASQVADFYIRDMERLGWQAHYLRTTPPLLLIFEKPAHLCTLLLIDADHGTRLQIFYGNKAHEE